MTGYTFEQFCLIKLRNFNHTLLSLCGNHFLNISQLLEEYFVVVKQFDLLSTVCDLFSHFLHVLNVLRRLVIDLS